MEGLIEGIVEPESEGELRSELIDGSALEKQLLQAARPEAVDSAVAEQVAGERNRMDAAPVSAPVSAPISAPVSAPVSMTANETLEGFPRGVSEPETRRDFRCRPRGCE